MLNHAAVTAERERCVRCGPPSQVEGPQGGHEGSDALGSFVEDRVGPERGVPVADVADLLGDDEKTVREHYSRWVPERQARLTKILKDAFDDKPKPKLVALPGGRS